MSRKYTNKLIEMMDDGLDQGTVLLACLSYMSEDEVKDMMQCNGLLEEENEEESDEE